jgi:hypothetical protein
MNRVWLGVSMPNCLMDHIKFNGLKFGVSYWPIQQGEFPNRWRDFSATRPWRIHVIKLC